MLALVFASCHQMAFNKMYIPVALAQHLCKYIFVFSWSILVHFLMAKAIILGRTVPRSIAVFTSFCSSTLAGSLSFKKLKMGYVQ